MSTVSANTPPPSPSSAREEVSPERGISAAVVVALIGAAATVMAALVGHSWSSGDSKPKKAYPKPTISSPADLATVKMCQPVTAIVDLPANSELWFAEHAQSDQSHYGLIQGKPTGDNQYSSIVSLGPMVLPDHNSDLPVVIEAFVVSGDQANLLRSINPQSPDHKAFYSLGRLPVPDALVGTRSVVRHGSETRHC